MKLTKKIAILTLALLLLVPAVTLAQNAQDPFGLNDATFNNTLGGNGSADLSTTITNIVTWILSFLGIVAVLIILYGGFIWMTAAGDDAKVEKAKKILVSGIIGLIIILAAYMIAAFVFNEVNDNLLNQ